MDEAEACRVRGNACFVARHVDDAIAAYRRGIDALTQPTHDAKHVDDGDAALSSAAAAREQAHATQRRRQQLLLSLYSNLSNAYATCGNYDACCDAARCAIALDARVLKPWLRYVEARRLAGYAFDAFVTYLRHVLPRIRRARRAASTRVHTAAAAHDTHHSASDAGDDDNNDGDNDAVVLGGLTLREVEQTASTLAAALQRDLGVSQLSPDVELVDCAGGYALVSRRHFRANEVVFVERQYDGMPSLTEDAMRDVQAQQQQQQQQQDDDDNDDSSSNRGSGTTTTHIALAFARYLRVEQQQRSAAWARFRRDFCGAWPRSLADVDAETRARVGGALRDAFAGSNNNNNNNNTNSTGASEDDELLVASLMCRYNCFHAGFFRVCALANHSCHANIAMKYASLARTVTMVTVNAIAPGQPMHVKYLSDAHFLLGVGKRRELLRSWLFWCACERCAVDLHGGEAAVQEQVRCASCAHFVHLPLPGDGVGADADPLLAPPQTTQHAQQQQQQQDVLCDVHDVATSAKTAGERCTAVSCTHDNDSNNNNNNDSRQAVSAARACAHCGADVAWPHARRALLRQLLLSFPSALAHETAASLLQWLHTQLAEVARVGVHPCHWLYRMLFYFCCIRATSLIDAAVRQVEQTYASLPPTSATTTATTTATAAALRVRRIAATLAPLFASAGLSTLYVPLLREVQAQHHDNDNDVVCNNNNNNNNNNNSSSNNNNNNSACDKDKKHATSTTAPLWRDAFVLSCSDDKDETDATACASTTLQQQQQQQHEAQQMTAPGDDGGGDLLRVLVVLWYLLRDFYPAQEMWAVHNAICWLVLLHLIGAASNSNSNNNNNSNKTALLSTHAALALLQRHSPYLGQDELRRWLHLYTTHRAATAVATLSSSSPCTAPLPSVKDMRQSLRLK